MSRKVDATYINNTEKKLILDTQLTKMKYGKFTEAPPAVLEANSKGPLFKAQNTSTLKGCGGDVWYYIEGQSAKKFHVYFNDPHTGENEANFNYSSDTKKENLDAYIKYNEHHQPMEISVIYPIMYDSVKSGDATDALKNKVKDEEEVVEA